MARRKFRLVVCLKCKTIYGIPFKQKRLKRYETCANEDKACDGRKFRSLKPRQIIIAEEF